MPLIRIWREICKINTVTAATKGTFMIPNKPAIHFIVVSLDSLP